MRKPGPTREVPPPLELLCLKALWTLEQGNVNDVKQAVAGKKPLAYTTVMTVLERLVKRNLVTRRKVGRSFLYAPQATRETIRHLALREFLDSYFDGSEAQLMEFLRAPAALPQLAVPPQDTAARLDTALL